MNNFIHISLKFPGVPKMRDLEPVIDVIAEDWIRLSAHSWILWTDQMPVEISRRLVPHLDNEDQFFIAVIDLSTSYGRLPEWIWTWIKNKGFPVVLENQTQITDQRTK